MDDAKRDLSDAEVHAVKALALGGAVRVRVGVGVGIGIVNFERVELLKACDGGGYLWLWRDKDALLACGCGCGCGCGLGHGWDAVGPIDLDGA